MVFSETAHKGAQYSEYQNAPAVKDRHGISAYDHNSGQKPQFYAPTEYLSATLSPRPVTRACQCLLELSKNDLGRAQRERGGVLSNGNQSYGHESQNAAGNDQIALSLSR